MLTQHFPFLDPRHATPAITARLRSLAEDAGRFEIDASFVPSLLHSAPIIDNYVPVVHSVGLVLVGEVVGHPHIWSRKIRTSQLWFADPGGQWVRTLSRFYRLGRPGSRDLWPSTKATDDIGGRSLIGDDDEDAWLEVIFDTTILAEGAAADFVNKQTKRFEIRLRLSDTPCSRGG